ncbi:MAG: hypothetical protein AzoDbin1_05380, partial [Azoarcus sp.]|nr:hypothetical protein [Azoarcus sp.]
DPMGGVWIIGYAAPFAASDSARWVDTTSGTITALALPKGFRPYQFGSDFVLGVQTGEDDGLTVARFGLKR